MNSAVELASQSLSLPTCGMETSPASEHSVPSSGLCSAGCTVPAVNGHFREVGVVGWWTATVWGKKCVLMRLWFAGDRVPYWVFDEGHPLWPHREQRIPDTREGCPLELCHEVSLG